ncbi:MAG: hypothetical protein JXQ85_00995 [Cognatishimia sp.]
MSNPVTRNLNTQLRRRRRQANPMAEYDALPTELRLWLADAALPWSPHSVRKLWQKALNKSGGQTEGALAFMTNCEVNAIKKDAPKVWSASYPIA